MPEERRSLRNVIGTVLVVLVTTSALVKALDLFGRVTIDTAELTFTSPNDLERVTGERLVLPAYFPDTIAWPPKSVRSAGGRRPRAAVLTFSTRDDVRPHLLIAQSFRDDDDIPPELMPASTVLEEGPLPDGQVQGQLARLLAADGVTWHQVALKHAGRSLLLRSRGSVAELLHLASSLRREGP